MPTWTLTSANGSQSSVDIADYKADTKGVVLSFAANSNNGIQTFHLAPAGKQAQIPGILSAGMGAISNIAGAAGGFQLAEAAISKLNAEGGFQLGGSEAKVSELAGGILGSFLAHAAAQSATKLYENRDIDSGDYYDNAGQLVFHGPVKVSGNGAQV